MSAFAVWTGPMGSVTASMGNQAPIRMPTERENI